MAVEVSISWFDANGDTASNSFTVADAAAAASALAALHAISNAGVSAASYATPLDLAGLTTPVAANVESAKFKMAITMSGDKPVGATARPKVILQVPAPIGTLINGKSGDPANVAFTALLPLIKTNRGETLNKIDSVNYIR
jgi:hypothetical protein